MAREIHGTTPVEGSCVYCGADLVKRWVERWGLGADFPTRSTDAKPWCVNGHPQPAPDDPAASE